MSNFLRLANGVQRSLAEDASGREQTVTAGENLAAGQTVYFSAGAADGGRTAGQAYLINPFDDNRIEFQGFVKATATAGNPVTVVFNAPVAGFTGLTPGQPVYADPAVLGGTTQAVNTSIGSWLINLGQAISATTVRVNPSGAAGAVYLDSLAQSNIAILNNQVTALAMAGLLFSGSTAAYIDYTINRSSSTTDFAQTGTLVITKKPVAGTWTLSDTYTGDNAGVTFSINSSGQILYTSTNVGGTSYLGSMIFNTRDNGNSVVKFAPTVQKFTSGSGTYTLPTGPRPLYIRVRMVGGGGGGGGGYSNESAGGGGSGAFIDAIIANPTAVSYSVGNGGAGNASSATGTAGGATTFGTNSAGGGSGGGGGGGAANGGAGGVATLALGSGTAVNGGGGGAGMLGGAGAGSGKGGSSALGGAGIGVQATSGTGGAGAANTGGGGGGGTSTSGAGGAGGSGVIIVEEFYQ